MLSLQRGIGKNAVLTVSYVGNQAHHLLVLEEANPGNPALCLQLSNPANLAPGQSPCGPFIESNVFVTASGQTINGTRGPLGPNFGSDTYIAGIGNSSYNSLQVTFKYASAPLQLLAAYTYSKSLDQSSDLGEEVNPLNPSLSRAVSAFDIRRTSSSATTIGFRSPTLSVRPTVGPRMGTFRHHAFQHRLPGNAGQLRRQLVDRRRAERHQ